MPNHYQHHQTTIKIAKPLTKKENTDSKQLRWADEEQVAFQKFNKALTPPVLANFCENKDTIISCNASTQSIGGVFPFIDGHTHQLLAVPKSLVRYIRHVYQHSLTAGVHAGVAKTIIN